MVLKSDMFFPRESEGYSSDEKGPQAIPVGEIYARSFSEHAPHLIPYVKLAKRGLQVFASNPNF